MKTYLLLICFIFSLQFSFAQNNIWQGPTMSNWNNAANWSLARVPLTSDTVIFNTGNECNVDIDPAIASLRVSGGGINLFSTVTNRIISINNNAAASPVLQVATASTLTLGGTSGSAGVSVTTFGSFGSNNAQVQGVLLFGRASSWTVSSGPAATNIDVSGNVVVTATSTAANVFISSTVATLRFLNGSSLLWSRNGGSVPVSDFMNGSSIFVSAITNSMVSFNSSSVYNGLITWSCAGQTISGASAVLLQSASASMDSIHIISTGTGTLRLSTEPQGYTLGHVEVQGGTLELSSPITGFSFGTITGNLKITGGNVIGNATFAADGTSPNRYPMTLTVNGGFIMTSGTFDLTNRPPVLNPAGAFQMNVKGDVVQSGGLVTTTSAFGSQNYIMLNGTVLQNLELTNFTGPASLVINNPAGVLLQNDLFISYVLQFFSGVLTTSAANLLTMGPASLVFGASNTSFADGPVSKTGNTAFTFPIGKTNCGPSGTVNGYAALEIANFFGTVLPTDRFTAEYRRGDALALGSNVMPPGLNHLSRCDYWTLTRNVGNSTVDITLSWNDPVNNCISSAPYVNNRPSLTVAHFNGAAWDIFGVAGVTSGTNAAGSVTWGGGSPQSLSFGTFTIASIDFNNPLPITINYFTGIKQNNAHVLNWKLTCNSSSYAAIEMERSTDGQNYKSIYSMHATALRCQQPFDHTDADPATGINYYRLKMRDDHGKISYSSIVSLLNATKGFDILNIAPNPVAGNSFDLKISAAKAAQMEIIITDMQGRVLQKKLLNLIAGFNTIPVNINGLAKGTYQLYGNAADGRSRVLRFVVQ